MVFVYSYYIRRLRLSLHLSEHHSTAAGHLSASRVGHRRAADFASDDLPGMRALRCDDEFYVMLVGKIASI